MATAGCLFVLSLHASLALPSVAMAAPDPDQRAARIARAFGTPIPGRPLPNQQVSSSSDAPIMGPSAAVAPDASPSLSDLIGPIHGAAQIGHLDSSALQRTMPYLIYLPPGYESGARRYPVLYMLRGNSGS